MLNTNAFSHNEELSNFQPGECSSNVFMAPEEHNYLKLPHSQFKLTKPLGWEVKHLQERNSPVATIQLPGLPFLVRSVLAVPFFFVLKVFFVFYQ